MHFNYSSEKGLEDTHCPRRMGEFNKLYHTELPMAGQKAEGV
jgi:hypothetical protein